MKAPQCTCSEPGPVGLHEFGCAIIRAYIDSGPPPTPKELELRAVAGRLGAACRQWIADVEREAKEKWEASKR